MSILESLDWYHWIILLLLLTVGSALLIEVIYFIRTFICVILSRYIKKRIHILEKCSISGICLTRDVDAMLNHMNNARYFRELDFARIDFYMRTGLYDEVRKNNGQIMLFNANVRFRKFIPVLARFKISTKIVYWDEDAVFLEHRFIGDKGLVHAVFLCQQIFIKCNGDKVMDALLTKGDPVLAKPEMPMEVSKFLELQDLSRKSLTCPL